MQVSEIIAKKRNGNELEEKELSFLLSGYLNKEIKDYQMSAWLMAVYFTGMTDKELSAWTRLMWKSGLSLPRENRNDFWVDKHSTGGVGDKTSLVLVPLVHQVSEKLLGKGKVKIPMISGRGLGHSGGTLDKLDSIPGFTSQVEIEGALKLLSNQGFFMLGQTEQIAPADKLIYALRDVTATVESNPLIVSSIMSKKLAESPDGIVFDVKTGTGAFMPTLEKAELLASSLVKASKKENVDALALISKMDEPLGWKVGNALEVEECADFLKGKQEKGMQEVIFELATMMVYLASKRKMDREIIRKNCIEMSTDPATLKSFMQMFEVQGGSWDSFTETAKKEKGVLLSLDYTASADGWVEKCEAKNIGNLLIEIGGGRLKKEDSIDSHVGFEFFKKCGDPLKKGDTIVRVFYRDADKKARIEEKLQKAIVVSSKKQVQEEWVVKKYYE